MESVLRESNELPIFALSPRSHANYRDIRNVGIPTEAALLRLGFTPLDSFFSHDIQAFINSSLPVLSLCKEVP